MKKIQPPVEVQLVLDFREEVQSELGFQAEARRELGYPWESILVREKKSCSIVACGA